MERLVRLRLRRSPGPGHRRLPRHGVRRHRQHAAARQRRRPAVASASVHLAEVGTTAVSGFSHWRFGNVDWAVVAADRDPGRDRRLPRARPSSPTSPPSRRRRGWRPCCSCWASTSSPASSSASRRSSSGGAVPARAARAARPVRRLHRRHGRRWLGSGLHADADLQRHARPAQGDRLGLRLGVRRHRRGQPRLPDRARLRGHRLARRRRAARGGVIAAPFAAYLVRHLSLPCSAPSSAASS